MAQRKMIITALNNFGGRIELSSNERLQDLNGDIESLPFKLMLAPGQTATVDDKFYKLRSIQSALSAGYITVSINPVVHSFKDLNDVPSSYVNQGNKLVKVNENETGLDFTVRLSVGNTEPSNPSINDLWVDTN